MGYLCDGRIQDSHSNQISSDAPSLGASPSGQSRPRQRYPEGFTCTSAASPPLPLPPHCLRLPTASALDHEVLGCPLSQFRFCSIASAVGCDSCPAAHWLECARASTARIAQARRPPTLTPSTAVPYLPLPLPPTPTIYLGPTAAVAITVTILTIVAIFTSADAQFFCAARVKAAAAASSVAATPAAPP
ncbi:hypothetical protein BKA58DRAFT_433607 [Alternaria rosae]|uniref:uncharacterized protein n=1 Tax=Alternaria rosae TaxID=1187941 RepID=UPI001E8D22D9|nr:uncharacterized protein BKA58DRAFT_433607 [Alternaria rosae]KAH6881835.1 hypothetical protein BKA58DRAFT_433607 [Alternaria rosae]